MERRKHTIEEQVDNILWSLLEKRTLEVMNRRNKAALMSIITERSTFHFDC